MASEQYTYFLRSHFFLTHPVVTRLSSLTAIFLHNFYNPSSGIFNSLSYLINSSVSRSSSSSSWVEIKTRKVKQIRKISCVLRIWTDNIILVNWVLFYFNQTSHEIRLWCVANKGTSWSVIIVLLYYYVIVWSLAIKILNNFLALKRCHHLILTNNIWI